MVKKFIYFAVAGDNATSYPVAALKGIDTAAGKLHLYFEPQRLTSVVTGDANDSVVLSVGADEKAASKALVDAICDAYGPKFLVVGDSENALFLANSGITAVDSINYAT